MYLGLLFPYFVLQGPSSCYWNLLFNRVYLKLNKCNREKHVLWGMNSAYMKLLLIFLTSALRVLHFTIFSLIVSENSLWHFVTHMTRVSMVCVLHPASSAKNSICILDPHISSHHSYSPFFFTVLNCLEDLPVIQTGENSTGTSHEIYSSALL